MSTFVVYLSIDWKIPVVRKFLPNMSSDYSYIPNKPRIAFDKSGALLTSGGELSDSGTYVLSHPNLTGQFIVELTVNGKSCVLLIYVTA